MNFSRSLGGLQINSKSISGEMQTVIYFCQLDSRSCCDFQCATASALAYQPSNAGRARLHQACEDVEEDDGDQQFGKGRKIL